MEDERSIALLTEVSRDLKKIIGLLEAGRSANRDTPGKLVELQEEILREPWSGSVQAIPLPPHWIDSLQAQKCLGISRSSIYRLTKENRLLYRKIGGRCYYLASDIFKLKDHYLK